MDHNAEILSLVNQATIALTQQNYTNALNAYAAALRIAKELKRSRLVAVAHRTVAAERYRLPGT